MELIIIGNGGHSKVIQEMVHDDNRYKLTAILDDRYSQVEVKDKIIYAPICEIKNLLNQKSKVVIAIGDNRTRLCMMRKLALNENLYATIIHPTAIISRTAKISRGIVILPNVCIHADAIIGSHSIINTGAIIEHDCNIGAFTHISPNATLTGNVTIGEGTHIGAQASVIPNVKIGSWSVVGAGSAVITDIPSYSTAVGCPSRIVKVNSKEKMRKRGSDAM